MNTHGFEVKDGHLMIGNFKVSDIAKEYKTPLYLMDEARIRQQMRTLCDEEVLFIDVVSGG